MPTATQENIALAEHIVSFISLIVAYIFNENSNIKCIVFINMLQHIIKIIRIIFFGFDLDYSKTNIWFCIIHSFINDFSRNAVVTFSCVLIFSLYYAYKRPVSFSKNHKKYRRYIYTFVVLFISSFILISLKESIFNQYTPQEMQSRNNCSDAYKYKFYQFLLISPLPNVLFIFPAMFCAISLMFKIKNPRNDLNITDINNKTNISFSRWIRILLITSILCIISVIYLFIDIKVALKAKIYKVEKENIDFIYYINASLGILIMIFTVSPSQVKAKFNKKENSIITDYNYKRSNSSSSKTNSNKPSTYSNNGTLRKDSITSENEIHEDVSNSTIHNNMRMDVANMSIGESQINSTNFSNNQNAVLSSPSMVYFKNILTNKNEKPLTNNNGISITDIEIIDNDDDKEVSSMSPNNSYMNYGGSMIYNAYNNNNLSFNNHISQNKSIIQDNIISLNSDISNNNGISYNNNIFYNNNNKRISNDNSTVVDTSRDTDDFKYLLNYNKNNKNKK